MARREGLLGAAGLLALTLAAGTSHGEVTDAQSNGFEVKQSVEIAAEPAKVWAALGRIGAWWDPVHTFSGSAANLSLELKVGGCFCESLPGGGGAAHMQVIMIKPGQSARLSGALGPMQSMGLTGHLTWTLAETNGHTRLTQSYDVGGYAPGGADKLAAPVDGVMTTQLTRLKHYVETGAPT